MDSGIYAMPMAQYLADPCPEPSLSGGVAHTILSASPAHARMEHPRLNPSGKESESSSEQDEGTALHALLLEGVDIITPVDAKDWRTNAAKEAREAARAAGRVPLLSHRYEALKGAATAIRSQIEVHEDAAEALHHGQPERVMIWRDGEAWCRARVDWLDDDPKGWLTDLKTTGGSAEPGAWGKGLASNGYAVGAAHYLSGARALGREPKGYRWIVAERNPPYAVSVVTLSPMFADLAMRQYREAVRIWQECVSSGKWPGYPPRTAWVDPPTWAIYAWEEREVRQEYAAKFSRPDDLVMKEGLG